MASIRTLDAWAKTIWDMERDPRNAEYEDCREGTKRHLRREANALMEAAGEYING